MKDNGEDFDLFDLDKHRLDDEWIEQPRAFREMAEKLADARRDMAQAKAQFELVEAELSLAVRKRPEDFGLEKTTESSIGSMVIVQKKYKEAQQDYIDAKHQVDVLEAGVNALDHRKKALENLVQLQARDYFAAPVAPKVDRERIGKMEREAAFGGKKKKGNNSDRTTSRSQGEKPVWK